MDFSYNPVSPLSNAPRNGTRETLSDRIVTEVADPAIHAFVIIPDSPRPDILSLAVTLSKKERVVINDFRISAAATREVYPTVIACQERIPAIHSPTTRHVEETCRGSSRPLGKSTQLIGTCMLLG